MAVLVFCAVRRRGQLTFLRVGRHREYDVGANWRERASEGKGAVYGLCGLLCG